MPLNVVIWSLPLKGATGGKGSVCCPELVGSLWKKVLLDLILIFFLLQTESIRGPSRIVLVLALLRPKAPPALKCCAESAQGTVRAHAVELSSGVRCGEV